MYARACVYMCACAHAAGLLRARSLSEEQSCSGRGRAAVGQQEEQTGSGRLCQGAMVLPKASGAA